MESRQVAVGQYLLQREQASHQLFASGCFEGGYIHSLGYIEVAGANAAQGGEVSSAAQQLAYIVCVRAYIETLAAMNGEIYLRSSEVDARNLVVQHLDVASFTFHFLTFSCQLIAGNAIDLTAEYMGGTWSNSP